VEVRTDRVQRVALEASVLREVLGRTDRYRAWWPWLLRFDGTELAEGEAWRCVVAPPLPYVVRFRVLLDEVGERRVAARVDGDIEGEASVDLAPAGAAWTELHLRSRLAASAPLLRAIGVLAGPLARFGHDRVVAASLQRLATHAEREVGS
jgi:hypothetical protein